MFPLLYPLVAVVGGLLLLFELLLSAEATGAVATMPTANAATAVTAAMRRVFDPIMSSQARGCYKNSSGNTQLSPFAGCGSSAVL